MKATHLLCIIALGLTSNANACSWESIAPDNVKTMLRKRFTQSDTVVRGVVSSIVVGESEQDAEIKVLHAFKGTGEVLHVSSSNFMCGYSFKQGEEKIFFIHEGRVGIATVEPAWSWLVAALESLAKSKNAPNKVLQRTRSEQRASEH